MENNYIEQYQKLYEIKKTYGATSIKLYDCIIPFIKEYKPSSILDYGCGKSMLIDRIRTDTKIKTYRYDPAIKECSVLPKDKIDFIICTDVLQHIPLFDLDRVLSQIKSFTSNCFFYIKCTSHTTVLPNGKPANCTVCSGERWQFKLEEYFEKVIKVPAKDLTTATFITKA